MGSGDNYYNEALQTLNSLQAKITENEDNIRLGVKGVILREYLVANDMAAEKLKRIKSRLLRLREEERQQGA